MSSDSEPTASSGDWALDRHVNLITTARFYGVAFGGSSWLANAGGKATFMPSTVEVWVRTVVPRSFVVS
jgi:hypothetical protein